MVFAIDSDDEFLHWCYIFVFSNNGYVYNIIIDSEPLKGPNTTFWKITIDNNEIGKVTSAVFSPRLKKNIALAMISVEHSEIGNKFKVTTNEGIFGCVIVEKPFYDPKKKIANS